MKKTIIFLLLLATNLTDAQIINGTIKDSLTQKGLEFSNVLLVNGKGTYADRNGKFQLNIKNSIYDTLKISTIGYKSKKIPLIKYKGKEKITLVIFLEPNIEELEEVIISTKKIKYTNKETLGEKREGNMSTGTLIGYETCVLIKNPRDENGKIKRVYINLKKRKNADYTATFNIKFYEYDVKKNEPGKELYSKNIYVVPKNKKYRLWVNVKDFNIKFPENGVCVGVEMVNTIGKVKRFTYFGPMYRYTLSDKSITWSNYHGKGWRDGSSRGSRLKPKKFQDGISNAMIGLEVLFPSS